ITGCTAQNQIEIKDNTAFPEIVIEAESDITCLDSEILLDASNSNGSPTVSYQWFDTQNNPINGQTENYIQVYEPGTYTLRLEDSETGCINEKSVTVEDIRTDIQFSRTGNTDLKCTERSTLLGVQMPGN